MFHVNFLRFLFSMFSSCSADAFNPVEVTSDSTVSLKQPCMRYDKMILWLSLSLIFCQVHRKKIQINKKIGKKNPPIIRHSTYGHYKREMELFEVKRGVNVSGLEIRTALLSPSHKTKFKIHRNIQQSPLINGY